MSNKKNGNEYCTSTITRRSLSFLGEAISNEMRQRVEKGFVPCSISVKKDAGLRTAVLIFKKDSFAEEIKNMVCYTIAIIDPLKIGALIAKEENLLKKQGWHLKLSCVDFADADSPDTLFLLFYK